MSRVHAQNPPSASKILPNLYISDLAFAERADCLSDAGVTHVLTVMGDRVNVPDTIPDMLMRRPHGFQGHTRRLVKKQVHIDDFPFAELAAHLPMLVAFIEDALRAPENVVLVHCVEGISRSTSVVAAYLMKMFRWSPSEAISFIKNVRPVANPNFGFVQQLWEYGRTQGVVTTDVGPSPRGHRQRTV
ncbi:phosphatases II [Fistulina hepatica ATCC 64428]|uniref:protein-tyrosine-phosphatase n=1 Tax=Fistulina hepatica ATCC 64428 TaxID=1128425 RepID=A0A0D7ADJ9_9AGAR|nr:phosphatases II [Fistulina hepatica ATCC 64428]